jgi:hypothetical protein
MKRREFIGLSTAAVSLAAARGAGEVTGSGKPILTFGLLTDVQYADVEPNGERHYRESIPKLKVAVEWLAKKELPFTLHLGDLIDRDFACFATVLPLLAGLGHPVRHLLGNHDYTVTDGEKARVIPTLGMERDYYSFHHAGVRFVMLDTNDLSIYKHAAAAPATAEAKALLEKLKAENSTAAKPWNGGISTTQLDWLERELAAADAAKERVIVCGHHPLLPETGHQVWNNREIIAVIERHPCVLAYLNGHDHAGAEVVQNGVPFITFKSLLHDPKVNAYSAVRVFEDRLEIEGNGREVSRLVAVRKV